MSSIDNMKISLQDILLATNEFAEANIIARGGFGKVYRGQSEHHGILAIKRLDRVHGQGDREFGVEIQLLTIYKHENLVSLVGFCEEGGEKILVYKYETNGSLDKFLHKKDLTWERRLQICLDAARGLRYLHDEIGAQHRVIHRDIKSANILLDENWKAKISDFGLSKVALANVPVSFLYSAPCGTYGYVDPEFIQGSLTSKSDVYSFGVVLFEVLFGKLVGVTHNLDNHDHFTVKMAQNHYQNKTLDKIIDPDLRNQISPVSLCAFSTIAYRCLKNSRHDRPTMRLVVEELEKALGHQQDYPELLHRPEVEEQIGLAKQEILASLKENTISKASTSVPKELKLQFRNKVSSPAYTGKPLLGENKTTIEIALVNAVNGQIVNNGPESMAKLVIVGLRVGDNESNDDSWTFEDFHKRVMGEMIGNKTLQGSTYLQLKEGVCLVDNISFTRNKENTTNGLYRLGAGVVDAAFMNGVEVARTEVFPMKDGRATYYEKHPHPCLSDLVYHLQQIGYKGPRHKQLQKGGVFTVKDLLILLYTDPKKLQDILDLKASSKVWGDIIKNAQASNGMFLYLDPSNECKAGVVLNVKLELKALIVGSHQYIPAEELSDRQKVDNQSLVKLACENLDMLRPFEDETSLREYLESANRFTSLPCATGTFKVTNVPPRPYKQVTYASPGLTEAPKNVINSNFHTDQSTRHAPTVTFQSEKGKEKVPFDGEIAYSRDCYEEPISLHPPNQESANVLNFGNATEPGTSSQAVECLLDTFDIFNSSSEDCEMLDRLLSYDFNTHLEIPNNAWNCSPTNSDADVVITQTVAFCTIAKTRWEKVSRLLRRNSIRERIRFSEGIQPLKKQRCF